jgi:hypothetical protein
MPVGTKLITQLIAIVAVVTGCGGAPAPAATDGPVDVVQAFMAARNAGDVDGAMSYLAEEGGIFGVRDPP